MNIYVNPSGTGDGTTRSSALSSIQAAVDIADPGDVILVAGGTYNEAVDVTTSGTVLQHITIRLDSDNGGLGGLAILDGEGNAQTLRFRGAAYWDVYDLRITNDGGDGGAAVNGLFITSTNGLAAGQGSHHLRFFGISIEAVNRSVGADHSSVPLGLYNPATTGAGGTAVHHIEFYGCSVYDCNVHNYPATDTFEGPLLAGTGWVHDVLFDGCVFDPNYSTSYGDTFGINVLEWGGPSTANPEYPTDIVVKNCRFLSGNAGLNFFRCSDVLVVGNYFSGLDSVAFEMTGEGLTKADPVGAHGWFIGNEVVNCGVGAVMGAWDDTFFGANDIYITNNTFTTTASAPPASAQIMVLGGNTDVDVNGLGGDNRVCGNLVTAPDGVLFYAAEAPGLVKLDRNTYRTSGSTSFWDGTDDVDFPWSTTEDRNSVKLALAAEIPTDGALCPLPPWWEPGLFGDYEPAALTSWNGVDLIELADLAPGA
jgi:hypothetical protein